VLKITRGKKLSQSRLHLYLFQINHFPNPKTAQDINQSSLMAFRIQNRSAATPRTTAHVDQIIERKHKLLTTFADTLYEETRQAFKEMTAEGINNIIVAKFCLPNQGAPPRATYWTGNVADDGTKNGVPIVMLLQGERDRETGTVHPERLPGGKSAIQLVNERLDKEETKCSIELYFEKRTKDLQIYLFDNSHAERVEWAAFLEKKKQERPARPKKQPAADRAPINEWVSAKFKEQQEQDTASTAAAVEADEEEGFQVVQTRRR
jgi:hypothetical protein